MLALENFSASIGTVGDAFDNAATGTVMGLFKHEAIRADSPFRTGPLHGLPDVEKITMKYVDWYNNRRCTAASTTRPQKSTSTPTTPKITRPPTGEPPTTRRAG